MLGIVTVDLVVGDDDSLFYTKEFQDRIAALASNIAMRLEAFTRLHEGPVSSLTIGSSGTPDTPASA